MLDIKFIRINQEKVKAGIAAKQLSPSLVDQVLELDGRRRQLVGKIDRMRAERKTIAESHKVSPAGKKLKVELKDQEVELVELEKDLRESLLKIPNLPEGDVKTGKDETENEVLRRWGEPKQFSFKIADHVELGERLSIIDIAAAAKVSGTRFGYLEGDAVLLELALVRFVLDNLIKEGFIPVIPPVLIKTEMLRGMGYLEQGAAEDVYSFPKDDLVLVGTSEQSLGPMHTGEVLPGERLPLRYAGFSSCFRREAGAYGKDTRGILRVHQFDKVEMFSFVRPGDGDKEHEYLLVLEERFFQALGIPYQVVKMCSGDLGFPASRKYDLEAWMPGQDKYREVTSTSTTTDFQARRLNIKYRQGKETGYVHTLNGTACAIGRTLIAILENYQQEDGSVVVPEVLRDYMGKGAIRPRT